VRDVVITDIPVRQPAPPRALRILVVDDDRDQVLSLTALLRGEAYDVRGLHDAADILQQVREYDPDVVILDIVMPGKTGWDAAKEIRAGLQGRKLVLIGISGEHVRGSDRALSEMYGFDFYLMKPCDPNVLLTLLRWQAIQSPHRSSFR
jgi:two-component system response regulator MtrA